MSALAGAAASDTDDFRRHRVRWNAAQEAVIIAKELRPLLGQGSTYFWLTSFHISIAIADH